MEDLYPDSVSKVSLAFSVGRAAKDYIVAEFGVGEELAMNLMGWEGDRLVCVAQMDTTWSDEDDDKIRRVSEAAVVIRRAWGVDSITLMAEGYMSTDPEFSRHMNLVDAWIQDKQDRVTECLSICHVERNGTLDVCAVPFRIRTRNDIEWGKLMRSESVESLRNSGYVEGLLEGLKYDVFTPETDLDTFYLAVSTGLAEASGFLVQYDL